MSFTASDYFVFDEFILMLRRRTTYNTGMPNTWASTVLHFLSNKDDDLFKIFTNHMKHHHPQLTQFGLNDQAKLYELLTSDDVLEHYFTTTDHFLKQNKNIELVDPKSNAKLDDKFIAVRKFMQTWANVMIAKFDSEADYSLPLKACFYKSPAGYGAVIIYTLKRDGKPDLDLVLGNAEYYLTDTNYKGDVRIRMEGFFDKHGIRVSECVYHEEVIDTKDQAEHTPANNISADVLLLDNDGKFDDEHRDLLFGLYNAIANMCEDFRYNPENSRYYILQEDRDAIQKALKDPDLDKAIVDGKFKLAVQEYDLDNKDMLGDQLVFYVIIGLLFKNKFKSE